jgi:outer membrane lipoprotein-sorting protein
MTVSKLRMPAAGPRFLDFALDRRVLLGAAAAATCGAVATALFGRSALAEVAPELILSEIDMADIRRVEDYLNGIQSMQTRFQQYSADGGIAWGTIYLRRPGRLRVEYDPPVPALIVADGLVVTYYDKELDQISQLPLGQTPAWFLLRETIDLTDGVTITAIERAPGALRIAMHQTDDPDGGAVSLIFSDQPLVLRQWTIIDQTGKEVRVGLDRTSIGVELSNNLFSTPAPARQTQNR